MYKPPLHAAREKELHPGESVHGGQYFRSLPHDAWPLECAPQAPSRIVRDFYGAGRKTRIAYPALLRQNDAASYKERTVIDFFRKSART